MDSSIADARKSFGTNYDLRARLKTGTFWNAIGGTTAQGSAFLANLLIANQLGHEGFGEFSIINATVAATSGIAQIATGLTATKYVAEFRDSAKERAGTVLGLCAVVSLVTGVAATLALVLASSWLATNALNAPDLGGALIVAAGYVLFATMNGFQQGALVGLESYRGVARISTAHGVLHVAVCAGASHLWGLIGALAAIAGSGAVRWLAFNSTLRREARRCGIRIDYRNLLSEKAILTRFASPAALAGFSTMPALWLANAFLVQQPSGYAQMGLFSAANNLKNIVLFLPALMNGVGTALINYQKGQFDEARYRQVFWVNVGATAATLLVAAGAIAASGKWLLKLYGPGFSEAYTVLLVLLLGALMEGVSIAVYQIVQSQEKMWLSLLAIVLPRNVVLLSSAYVLTAGYGALGLAVASALSAGGTLLMTIFAVQRIGLQLASQGPVVRYEAAHQG